MAAIPTHADPTLEAVDRAIEAAENARPGRDYLGMSAVGHPCERNLWYSWRWTAKAQFDAETLKRFADGHAGEDVQVARLRMVDGIELHTTDPATGEQFGLEGCSGHLKGHMDGAILGLLQAASTWHVYEHKQTAEKKQKELAALIVKHGEKGALAHWNEVYFAQAQLYMHYSGMERHYLTCSTPGGRSTISVRTDYDKAAALRIVAKAERIVAAKEPPARMTNDPSFFMCKWCPFSEQCHADAMPARTCRSCMFATPVDGGAWHCGMSGNLLSRAEQEEGCIRHLYIPGTISGTQTDSGDDWVEYQMRDGSTWRNTEIPY